MTEETSKTVEADQIRQNLTTRHQWGFYNSHRQAMERLIVPADHAGRICVLGAGNCNDLDLQWLGTVYREIHLVDLDHQAIAEAATRQKVRNPAQFKLHAPVDLTGISDLVAEWNIKIPDDKSIAKAIGVVRKMNSAAASVWDNSPAAVDLVLSPCVLTQTINPARNALRDHFPLQHPLRIQLRDALITRHLKLMTRLLRKGGKGVLAVDLISQEHFSDLARVPENELSALFAKYVSENKHYPGLDPESFNRIREGDSELSRSISRCELRGIWRWHLGLRKCFVVYGLVFEKLIDPVTQPAVFDVR